MLQELPQDAHAASPQPDFEAEGRPPAHAADRQQAAKTQDQEMSAAQADANMAALLKEEAGSVPQRLLLLPCLLCKAVDLLVVQGLTGSC